MSARTAEQVQEEISGLLRHLAEPVNAGESIQQCIRKVSMRAGLPYGQIKRMWYGEWKKIPAHIADHLRERAAAHDRRLQQSALQTLLAMRESNPDLFSQSIEALGDILHRTGQERGSSRRSS